MRFPFSSQRSLLSLLTSRGLMTQVQTLGLTHRSAAAGPSTTLPLTLPHVPGKSLVLQNMALWAPISVISLTETLSACLYLFFQNSSLEDTCLLMAARDLASVNNLVKHGSSGYSSEGQESAVKLQPRRLFWRLGESRLRADGSLYISCRARATKLSLQPGPGG